MKIPFYPIRITVNALIAMTILAISFGCAKNDPTLSISPTTTAIVFSAEATESFAYKVTTNQSEWDAVSDKSWCIITRNAADDGFVVTAIENSEAMAPEPANITVTARDAAPIVITATQTAAEVIVTEGGVYISGYYDLDSDYNSVACYWIDGERYDLEIPTSAMSVYTTSIDISEGKVYVSGSYLYDGWRRPCYWMDGELVELSSNSHSSANSIAVSDSVVYVAGYYSNNNGLDHGCYWINGTRYDMELPEGGILAVAESIAATDGSFYIAGSCLRDEHGYGFHEICYWENGVHRALDTPELSHESYATSITVSAGSVYIDGICYMYDPNAFMPAFIAHYWIDGVYHTLPDNYNSSAYYTAGIDIWDSSVYIAGYYNVEGRYVNGFWVDGIFNPNNDPADAGLSAITDIAVYDMVYMTGWYYTKENIRTACYWANSELTELDVPENAVASHASGIAIAR